jgi:hypothetical protein
MRAAADGFSGLTGGGVPFVARQSSATAMKVSR